MTPLLFDYGATLDTAPRHWNYVLLDGVRAAAQSLDPQLARVDGEVWREAYVHGERTLAQQPIIRPSDDFRSLLLKKVRIELQWLREHEVVQLADDAADRVAQFVADHCDRLAASHVSESATVLAELARRGYPMVLVTNFYGNIAAVLRAYGVDHFFPTIVESAVVGVRKPDPAIWQLGVEAAGVAPQQCVAIGDSYGKDIAPAHSLGCQTIWFEGQEWTPKSYDRTLPTHIITHISHLLQLLP